MERGRTMVDLNRVMLMGRLTADPEVRSTQKGTSVAKFCVALNRKWKDAAHETHDEATFVDIEAWGKQSELIRNYFSKGRSIFIEGRLRQDKWEKDGKKHNRMCVVLERF